MRVFMSILVLLAFLITGGCAVIEKEATNRGGYFDYVLDRHWIKADSKSMRALRAFAMQVSLARLASVVSKNEEDRELLARRIGSLTKRFKYVFLCAFELNPLTVPAVKSDPCFYYDSAMVNYSNGLFDLAKVALPAEESKSLVNTITGGLTNPMDLLDSLLQIARDALIYGRVVGALYRDSIELEVLVWLATPTIDPRHPPDRVEFHHVERLRRIYLRGDDNMEEWVKEMAGLRSLGLEPIPHPKFFYELDALKDYICGLITKDTQALANCRISLPKPKNLPKTLMGADAGSGAGKTAALVTGR